MLAGQIEAKLEEAFDAIHGLQADLREAGRVAAGAKVDYEVAFAQHVLIGRDKGLPVEAAKAEATTMTKELYRAYLLADTEHKTARSAISVCSSQVDILRTLAASHRGLF
jgi:hypothetical protein